MEAYDDPVTLVSQIKLEVVLFKDAINNHLDRIGLTEDLGSGKQVVILINENSMIVCFFDGKDSCGMQGGC